MSGIGVTLVDVSVSYVISRFVGILNEVVVECVATRSQNVGGVAYYRVVNVIQSIEDCGTPRGIRVGSVYNRVLDCGTWIIRTSIKHLHGEA
jgi:hypothetical protein